MTKQERGKQWEEELIRCLDQLSPDQQQGALMLLKMLSGAAPVDGDPCAGEGRALRNRG